MNAIIMFGTIDYNYNIIVIESHTSVGTHIIAPCEKVQFNINNLYYYSLCNLYQAPIFNF